MKRRGLFETGRFEEEETELEHPKRSTSLLFQREILIPFLPASLPTNQKGLTSVSPSQLISSKPSFPQTTQALSIPFSFKAFAKTNPKPGE